MTAMHELTRLARPVGRSVASWAGFSLVELMVSVTISLVIVAALVAMFVTTSGRNREMALANGMIENGRLTVQVLENDIVHAGFWGSFVPAFDDQTSAVAPVDVPTAVPDPCLAYTPANWSAAYMRNLVGLPLQAYEHVAVCGGVITDKQANTDVLVVRHADTCVPGSGGNCEADVPGRLYFQSSRCLLDPPGTPYVLDTTGHTLRQRNCLAGAPGLAEKRRFISSIYYVRNYAVTPGDGIPTLMRSEFDLTPGPGGVLQHQPPVALIEGVEGFRVEFGVDDLSKTGAAVDYTAAINWQDPLTRTTATNRGDGAPDGVFRRCTTASPCTVAQLMNITAVQLYVLARSREPSRGHIDSKTYALGASAAMGPFNDSFKRHVFVTTARLPNFSGRRMTP